ncbi:MAG: hypothetical protein ACLFS9_08235 [Nitriliruptoraceae bacterium]
MPDRDDEETAMQTAKTLGVLIGLAVAIGIVVAIAANLLFDDPSGNTALAAGAITGLVVVLVLRPIERHLHGDDR